MNCFPTIGGKHYRNGIDMDKSLFFELSNKVIAISQEHGISPTTLKTYAGVLAIATGALAMGSLSLNRI
jgi:hypothetical protein